MKNCDYYRITNVISDLKSKNEMGIDEFIYILLVDIKDISIKLNGYLMNMNYLN